MTRVMIPQYRISYPGRNSVLRDYAIRRFAPRGGIRRLLTCSSFPPRNVHGTRHDKCHFSACPLFLTPGHLAFAGMRSPSDRDTCRHLTPPVETARRSISYTRGTRLPRGTRPDARNF